MAAQPLNIPSIRKPRASDFTGDLDLTLEELETLLALAADVKQNRSRYRRSLDGQSVALLFEKPSLRTRMTFELAVRQMGGETVLQDGLIGGREPIKDVARNLDRWVDAIVARVFHQRTLDELALWASAPVINALSDETHPCQILADVQTLREHFGGVRGLELAFVGDGNNVAHSLLLTGARLGMHVRIGCPKGYSPLPRFLTQAAALADASGGSVAVLHDPAEAVAGANAVYTDVWASMGHEHEAEERNERFGGYQVNAELMAKARPGAVFLHCLPAKRGLEVTDDVMESGASLAFEQAENRLHAQKALLLMHLANS